MFLEIFSVLLSSTSSSWILALEGNPTEVAVQEPTIDSPVTSVPKFTGSQLICRDTMFLSTAVGVLLISSELYGPPGLPGLTVCCPGVPEGWPGLPEGCPGLPEGWPGLAVGWPGLPVHIFWGPVCLPGLHVPGAPVLLPWPPVG